ncbi:hypothetical protein [Pontibacter akesuensis]|uniref:PepSY domain-containing protein n=1 Tax=Pontibacter akesuensis TaxID=388950 RepID=A0A1I7JKU2_9BACT|nr:hypothetical protein [Pontibacter akesuensis]GHA69268.1 hypothetical protein GCM10007389_22940 [Pontibacter akesuensis]SFU85780.1 hypothetical protein SAMN04487941_2981 [Pontibacter akesuensis]
MKKVTVFAAAIAILGLTSLDANAQTQTEKKTQAQTQTQQDQQTQTQGQQQAEQVKQDGRELVKQDQLPEGVQNALKSDVYKDWTVGEIYKVAPAAGAPNAEVVYEVRMTNAQGQAGVVRMNEKGGAASTEE